MCKYSFILICSTLLSSTAVCQERQLQCSHFFVPFTETVGEAISVAISPEGGLVACADKSNRLEIWETQKGSLFASVSETEAKFESVQFSPDGKVLLMGMSDGTVRRWSIEDQQKQTSTKVHDAPVIELRYSPDGSQLATIAKNDVTIVQDVKKGAEIKRFKGNAACLSWSNDSKSLLIGGIDDIQVRNIESGEVDLTLEGADGAIGATTVSISPDGKYAAAGHPGEDFATVWELPSGKVRTKLVGHKDEIATISFDPSAKTICTTSLDGTVRNWDAISGKLVSTQDGISAILSRSICNTSNFTVTGGKDGEILVWDADRIRGVLRSHKGDVRGLELSQDGNHLSASVRIRSQDDFVSRISWPMELGSITSEKLANKQLLTVEEQIITKDSKLRARRNGAAIGISRRTDSQWSEDVIIKSQHYEFVGMQFIKGSNALVAANHSRLLRFDCDTGKETLTYETPLKYIRHFAASASGNLIVLINNSCEMELYSFADESAKWQREIKILESGPNLVRANYVDGIEFLSEDKMVLSADGALQIWRIGNAEVLFAQPFRNNVKITHVASCGNEKFVTISTEWEQGEASRIMRLCTFDGKRIITVASVKLGADEISRLDVSESTAAILDTRGAILAWSLTTESQTNVPVLAAKQKVHLSADEEAELSKLLRDLDNGDVSLSSKLNTIRLIGQMKKKAASAVDRLASLFPPKIEFAEYGEPKPSAQLAEALAGCLAQIGEESVPHLVKIMKLRDPAYSYLGVSKLAELRKNAKSCGPELDLILKERLAATPESSNQYQSAFISVAIQNLHEMDIDPSIAIPLLVQIVSTPKNVRQRHRETMKHALQELKEFGAEAKSATSALVKLINEVLVASSNSDVSEYLGAIEVLGAIGPDAEDALPILRAVLKSDKQLPRSLAQDAERAIRMIKAKIE